jgi:hypothetical protein
MSIIGIILGVVAISLFVWIKKEQQMNFNLHDGDIEAAKHAFNALMDDLNHYQIETDRKIADLTKQIEIKERSTYREIDKMKSNLPTTIRNVIGHIEFAKPLDKK